MDTFIALYSGEEIPFNRIALIKWYAQHIVRVGVEITSSGEDSKFLMTEVESVLFQRRAFIVDVEGTSLLETHERVINKSAVVFLESPIFQALKDSAKQNLIDAIKEADKRTKRYELARRELREAASLLESTSPQFVEIQHKATNRKQRYEEACLALEQLVESLGNKPKKAIAIDEAREQNWWSNELSDFFERLINESTLQETNEIEDALIQPEGNTADDDDDDDDDDDNKNRTGAASSEE